MRRASTLLLLGSLLLTALPSTAQEGMQAALERAHAAFRGLDEGETAQYIPALAAADPSHFGLVIATVGGQIYAVGDTDITFAIMSAAKPFTLALLLQQQGRDVAIDRIGVEPTGLPFNALQGVDKSLHQPLNPMVNAGAITTVSLLQVESPEQRWPLILDYYSEFAGETHAMMDGVYKSDGTSNYNSRAIVNLLMLNGWLGADPASTLDINNKQSSVGVTAKQLAAMGATLANGGVNPLTGKRLLAADLVDELLSVMLLSGFYDESGWWAYNVGLPSKSGVGGGIVAVVPGRMALAGYSPRLSPAGNSVRAMRAIESIAREYELNIFRPPPQAAAAEN